MMTWEELSRTENEVLSRTVVEGGWLYRYPDPAGGSARRVYLDDIARLCADARAAAMIGV